MPGAGPERRWRALRGAGEDSNLNELEELVWWDARYRDGDVDAGGRDARELPWPSWERDPPGLPLAGGQEAGDAVDAGA